MDERKKVSESLQTASVSIQISKFNEKHHFEVKKRKLHHSFGLILDGQVTFSMLTSKVEAKEGDLIFVPEGVRYISHWSGTPNIRFINLHFRMLSPTAELFRYTGIQKVENPPASALERLKRMAEFVENDHADELLVLSEFYRFCSEVTPLLKREIGKSEPPALRKALEYINENYTAIGRVEEISKACFLSESHLYHLFQEHLGVSPITYLNSKRVQEATEMLVTTDKTVETVSAELGFHSGFYFRKVFKQITGTLPSEYRKKG